MSGLKSIYRLLSLSILLITLSTSGFDDIDPETEKEIRNQIKRLGDGEFKTREAAARRLILQGEQALPFLIAAKNSRDPEIAYRASQLITGILKNTKYSSTTGIELALLNTGEFTMGSPSKERGRQTSEQAHQVKINKYFMIGAKEVTQDQFAKIMHFQPSYFSPTGEGKQKVNGFQTGSFPVDSVTWYDAIMFCNKLSEKDNLPKHYEVTEVEREGKSIVRAKVSVKGGTGYRLPTEAEWEYACRAGTSTPYHFGTRGAGGNFKYFESTGYGRSRTSALGRTTKGGSYKPNAWGLYDMHGNVAEWCFDWYSQSYYSRSPEADPPGPKSGVLSYKVLRGGSFLVNQSSSRSASRFYTVPKATNYFAGFRVARDLSKYVNEAMKAKSESESD